jgi:hypothetical protein
MRLRGPAVWLAVIALAGSCRSDPSGLESRTCDCGFRTILYTKDFGARFGLPAKGERQLDEGLQAVALRVFETPGIGYECEMDLYLTAGLELALREGWNGLYMPRSDPLFFMEENSGSKTVFGRDDEVDHMVYLSKAGMGEGHAPTRYLRGVFDQLDLVTFEAGCGIFDPNYGPASMWIKRRNTTARLVSTAPSRTVAYEFRVPDALLSHAAQATRNASKSSVANYDQISSRALYSIPP